MRSLLLSLGLTVLVAGCAAQSVIGQQLSSMRAEMPAVDTLHDLQVAESALRGNLGQYESYHAALPDDPDGLFILARGWTQMGFSFIEEDFEAAYEAKDRANAAYHLLRARAAYDRAIFFGKRLLEVRKPGFALALSEPERLPTWLDTHLADDAYAEEVLWTGVAYLNRVRVSERVSKKPEQAAQTTNRGTIGVALVQHALKLNSGLLWGFGHALLGAHFARFDEDPSRADQAFEQALKTGNGQFALNSLLRAGTVQCMRGDRVAFDRDLAQVMATQSRAPELRLWNQVAKRRAQRYVLFGGPLRHCKLGPPPTAQPQALRK